MTALLVTLGIVALLYLGILYAVARFSVHPFRTPLFFSPGLIGVPQENVKVIGREGKQLSAWWLPNPEAKTVIILAHGYMMNMSEPSAVAAKLNERGYACLLFDFPGHGRSPNAVVTLGLREAEDVAGAVALAREKMPHAKVVVWGSSMGAAATVLASPNLKLDGMVLDSVYAELLQAAQGWWLFLGGKTLQFFMRPTLIFARVLAKVRLKDGRVTEALKKTDCPVLLMHGDADTMVPLAEAERNQRARAGIDLHVYHGCNHAEGRWVHSGQYYADLYEWLERHGFTAR
ncbi:MAG: alpha/beta fold hydrolase [Chthonomonas sp.]|nr:alpha/beta fold hydrolase [Chthonomonas sp.]